MKCEVERDNGSEDLTLKLLLRLEDTMNRQLVKTINNKQSGMELATDLVYYGLINEVNKCTMFALHLAFL